MRGLLIATVVIIGIVYFMINGWHLEISKGEQTGFITAVETNGIFFKTQRVYVKSELGSSQEEAFCVVMSPEETDRLKQAAINQERLTVEFVDWFARGIKYCGATDIAVVTAIK
jgi:hypothetical protein